MLSCFVVSLVVMSLSICCCVSSMCFSKLVVVLLGHLADVDDNVESIYFDRTCCRRCRFRILMSSFLPLI